MYQRGVTLIELVIVLLIIGLIAGGITIGRSMIHSSQLQSVVTDVNHYKEAVTLFQAKYHELPGDFPGAENVWGSDVVCDALMPNNVPKTATCKGNGLGIIGDNTDVLTSPDSSAYAAETSLRAWQHLADAGFIDGIYIGTVYTGGVLMPGQNIPLSRLNNNGYTLYHAPSPNNHVIAYGSAAPVSYSAVNGAALQAGISGNDAYYLDNKTDDGQATTGNVLASGATASCAVGTTYNNNNGSDASICSLLFVLGF